MPGGDKVGPTEAPWVLVGGSYSGALTGWTMFECVRSELVLFRVNSDCGAFPVNLVCSEPAMPRRQLSRPSRMHRSVSYVDFEH